MGIKAIGCFFARHKDRPFVSDDGRVYGDELRCLRCGRVTSTTPISYILNRISKQTRKR